MKLFKILAIVFLFLFLCDVFSQTSYYYYYKGEKYYFSLNTEYAFISLNEPLMPDNIIQRNITFSTLQSDKGDTKYYQGNKRDCRFWTEIRFQEKLSEKQYMELLLDIRLQNKNVIISPYFKSNEEEKTGLSNFFYVKLKTESDTTLLRQMTEQMECIIIEQDVFMPLWFVVSITSTSSYNSMELANLFYESGLFQSAAPDLMGTCKLTCVNDTYFNDQWGLKNIGQYGGMAGIDIKACDAWQVSTGSNIIVAVVDEGVEFDHPDLAANIYPLSYDTENNTIPSAVWGDHGVPCAGIIGAVRNNNKGVAGVAPNSKIMSISNQLVILGDSIANILPMQKRARGINWAWQNGADIISNSWYEHYQYELLDDAINNAVLYGREERGSVVVFASGNNGGSSVSYPARLPNVIAVGAISNCGERKSPLSCDGENWGSNYGSEIDVVAPGVFISTTDRHGNAGYNYNGKPNDYSNRDYTRWFTGTSAACPHVAGVAALVLSVNPNLTGQQVRNIIESTAQKIRQEDLYNYETVPNRPNGTWHEEMGYGLVDAHAAVLAACETICYDGLPIVHGTITQNTTWNTNLHATGNLTIPTGVTLTINDTLKCEGSVSITIHPGGKLIIDGGTLTNACEDQMWQGITILGDPAQPLGSLYQPYVLIRQGGIIENAITGINTNLSVREFCLTMNINGLCEKMRTNSFFGFNNAINASNSGAAPVLNIGYNIFNNNYQGVTINGIHYHQLNFNDFKLPQSESFGAYISNSTGYKIEENSFQSLQFNQNQTTVGLVVYNSGTAENEVYKNSFDSLTVGQLFTGNNGNSLRPYTGLQTLCNTFYNNMDKDTFVGDYPYVPTYYADNMINKLQGSMQKPAGNLFYGNPVYHIEVQDLQGAIGYFYGNQPAENPFNTRNVSKYFTSNTNTCPSKAGYVVIKTEEDLERALLQYDEWNEEYEYWQVQFLAVCGERYAESDNEECEHILQMISYYSALKDNYFNAIIVAVMNDEMIEGEKDEVIEGEGIAGQARNDEGVPEGQGSLYENYELGIRNYELLRYLFAYRGHYTDNLSIVETYLAENNYSEALTTVTQIFKQFELSEEQVNELMSLQVYIRWLKQLAENDGSIYQLSENEIEYLINYVATNTGRGTVFAHNILCELYSICLDGEMIRRLDDEMIEELEEENLRKSVASVSSVCEKTLENITVMPNPTTGELRIENGELRIMDVEVFDMYGRKQKGNSPPFMEGWQPQADGVVINISHLQSGIYFVKISTEPGTITKKVIKF